MSISLDKHSPQGIVPLAIGAVALAVRDLGAMTAFYRDAIGLEVLSESADRALLGAGGAGFLELLHRPAFKAGDPASAGLFHTAFLLPSRADLGRWLRHAAETGLRLDGAADHLVSEAVYLHDPEGNGIEIYSDRPASDWRWQGDQVVMANDRLDMIGLRGLASDRWAGAPAGTRIGHVHLRVGDVEAAERFYIDRLGFAVTRRWPQALFMSTGGYHHHLATNTWASAGAGLRDPAQAGLASVTLVAADPSMATADGVRDPWGTLFHIKASNHGVSA